MRYLVITNILGRRELFLTVSLELARQIREAFGGHIQRIKDKE